MEQREYLSTVANSTRKRKYRCQLRKDKRLNKNMEQREYLSTVANSTRKKKDLAL